MDDDDGDGLVVRLEACLRFATRTLKEASPSNDLWAVDLGQVSGFEKMTLEAALLAFVIPRDGWCKDASAELLETLRSVYDSDHALSMLTRHPTTVTTLGTTLLVLDQFGLTNQRERDVLRRALESPYLDSSERVPFRLLDRLWVLQLAGLADVSEASALIALSLPCRATHPVYMTREDAYALTHSVMYVTDFGAREPPAELRDGHLLAMLDACIAWCASAEDFDLVAELLLAQVLLRGRLSEYGLVGWNAALRVWDDLGFLPSPSLCPEEFEALADDGSRTQYAFYHMYHTIFVAALCCNAMLNADTGHPDPSPGPWRAEYCRNAAAVRHGVARAANHLGVDADDLLTMPWVADDTRVDELARRWCSSSRRSGVDLIGRMAVDAFLIERARSFDLGGLAAGLRRALTAGTFTPTDAVALGFLAQQLPLSPRSGAVLGEELGAHRLQLDRVTAALAGSIVAVDRRMTTLAERNAANF